MTIERHHNKQAGPPRDKQAIPPRDKSATGGTAGHDKARRGRAKPHRPR